MLFYYEPDAHADALMRAMSCCRRSHVIATVCCPRITRQRRRVLVPQQRECAALKRSMSQRIYVEVSSRHHAAVMRHIATLIRGTVA